MSYLDFLKTYFPKTWQKQWEEHLKMLESTSIWKIKKKEDG